MLCLMYLRQRPLGSDSKLSDNGAAVLCPALNILTQKIEQDTKNERTGDIQSCLAKFVVFKMVVTSLGRRQIVEHLKTTEC